jgi:hypothetical protein
MPSVVCSRRLSSIAKTLKALSQAAAWVDSRPGPRPEYGWFSVQFQQLTDEIAAKAAEKNFDGATLGYLQLMATCVRCHRNIRDVRK